MELVLWRLSARTLRYSKSEIESHLSSLKGTTLYVLDLVLDQANGQEEDLPLRSLKRGLGGGIDGVAQEYFVCNEEDVVPIPANMSFEEAATMPVAYTTAWSSLFGHHPKLQSGQTVLCLGTGGVSLCAAQVGPPVSHVNIC
jgi:hypothetical protein